MPSIEVDLPKSPRLFNSIEMCVRRHLTILHADKMDETFKTKLMELVIKDDDVLFYWCLAGQIEGDEAADKSLAMMVNNKRLLVCKKVLWRYINRKQRRELKRPNRYVVLCLLDHI